ncbi:probable ion channel CASTOR [Ricinus communis]|uniref:Uncharacterized protein n=1 Tax=Ricinus communis TaxID=3988 RepID=B9S2W2_RICCO|nr:probable ion channel CASTOR [Ricinus communis]EEF42117.1 conserved hypothetical protein [Ricinus communis]|eukprot:XP_015575366.1 probable ion channel CASTOR [Ricinus communis]
MTIDDSFKKPGAVPFKWEIRPGVPKIQHHQQPKQLSPPKLPSPSPPFNLRRPSVSPLPTPQPQLKLKPPPAGFIFLPPPEPRTHSFRSAPRTRSERWRFDQPTRVGPECVSPGCFPSSPLLKRKGSKRRTSHVHIDIPGSESEGDYVSDLETLARWSLSSRKSFSPFNDSSVSSYSSSQSSPRPVSDAEWAGFGLF